jgi:hypothetical protein
MSSSVVAEVPTAIRDILQQDHPQIKFRLDDLAQTQDKLWLLVKPRRDISFSEGSWAEFELESQHELGLLEKTTEEDYLFSNGWIYTPIKDNTIKSYDYYPESFQKVLLQSLINQGFLIPAEFVLPRDLAMLAGRLPLNLGSVELATDRELVYKERLKEEEKTKDLEFLAYTVENGSFSLVSIKRNKEDDLINLELETLDDISTKIRYASKIKKIDGEVYISDQTEAKIYKLNRKQRLEFDATKPLSNQGVDSQEIVNELELFLDLNTYVKNKTGIRDFEFNKNKSNIYVLTTVDSKLHIIDTKKEIIIKSIELPAAADGMKLVSRSVSEPDKLVFRSRSGAKVYIVNTFDYRVTSALDLNEMNETYRFIPNDLLVTTQYILVATEVLYRSPAMPKDSMGKILAIDSVTGKLISLVDLDFVPFSMAFSGDERTFFAIGSNLMKKTIIAKINSQILSVMAKADLSPDIIDSKNITSSSAGRFMLVPSAASNQVGVIDLETCTLVKKLDINKTSSVLLAL